MSITFNKRLSQNITLVRVDTIERMIWNDLYTLGIKAEIRLHFNCPPDAPIVTAPWTTPDTSPIVVEFRSKSDIHFYKLSGSDDCEPYVTYKLRPNIFNRFKRWLAL